MPNMLIELSTRRLESEIKRHPGCRTDFDFRLCVEAAHFAQGRVDLQWGEIVTSMELPKFHRFCIDSRGRTREAWFQLISDQNILHITAQQIQQLESSAWYLMKASMLIYLWTEVAVLNGDYAHLEHHLHDEFVLDYTGNEGPQRHIYFLPSSLLQPANDSCLHRLYALNLLSRLSVTLDQSAIVTYFTPIQFPIQGVFKFDDDQPNGGPCYRLWRTIVACTAKKLQAFTEGGR